MKNLIVLACLLLVAGCKKDPELTDAMLGGEVIFDPSTYEPEKYLISLAAPDPTPAEAATPVVIAVHGYSASTFEWAEFRTYLNGNPGVKLSQVLMGGHGTTYENFKKATWEDWRKPVLEEYFRLEQAGYTNINFACSSAGAAVILKILSDDQLANHIKPKQVFLIDPIIVPSDKSLSLVGIAGPVIGYIDTKNSVEEDKYWYHYRPYETLKQLRELTGKLRMDLQKGFSLPADTELKVYKSKKDETADPVSAVLIYKGIRKSNGSPTEVEMIDSKLHVFTRLSLRENVTQQDFDNQRKVFEDMVSRLR